MPANDNFRYRPIRIDDNLFSSTSTFTEPEPEVQDDVDRCSNRDCRICYPEGVEDVPQPSRDRDTVLQIIRDSYGYADRLRRDQNLNRTGEFALPPSGDPNDWQTSPDAERIRDFIHAGLETGQVVRASMYVLHRDNYSYGDLVLQRAFFMCTENGIEQMSGPPALRRCARCGTRLTETRRNFYQRSNGWSSWCIECSREYQRARYAIRKHGRRFGVEIEFVSSNDYIEPEDVVNALDERGIICHNDGYTHEVHTDAWKIVSDGSVDNGWELVSPPLHWKDRDQVTLACEALRSLGATADRTCGLHVHHEVADLNLDQFKRMYRNWSDCQNFTDRMTALSRRNGQWSGHLQYGEMNLIEQCDSLRALRDATSSIGRYRSLNVLCYPSYGTVEVRQHQGTVNARKILAWVAYGQAFIKACESEDTCPSSIEPTDIGEYLAALPFDRAEDREYLLARADALV